MPLISVLYMLIIRGGRALGLELFTQLPPAGLEPGGGFGNAIVGTLVMVAIASLISVPFGILGGVFLGVIAPDSRLADATRFIAKVLTGFPSILAGVFVYAWLVLAMGTYSAIAGGVALAVLMLPTVMLTAEQSVRMVPQRMKDAAFGMGCTETQTVWKVVLPTALPGILTGHHARGGGRGRQLGAAPLHRALLQLLDRQLHGADGLAARSSSTTSRACRSRTRSSSPGRPRWCWC